MKSKRNRIEYEKLLTEAQEKHKAFKHEVDSYIYDVTDPLNVLDIIQKKHDAEEAWYSWLKRNITDKGFHLEFDVVGRPYRLLKVLAIQYASYV